MELIGTGLLMGIAFAAPPGALTTEAIRRGFAGPGFRAAMMVGLGSLIGDAFYALLALAGLATLMDRPVVRVGVGVVGTAVLLWLALSTIRQAIRGTLDVARAPHRAGGAFASGMAISLTNPFAVVFWLSLGGTVAAVVGADASAAVLSIFFGSFLLGSALWVFILAALVHWGRRFLGQLLGRWITLGCGLALAGFAIYLGYQIVQDVVALWS